MKFVAFAFLSFCLLFTLAKSGYADTSIAVTAGMQACMKHSDCALTTTSCLKPCAVTPINEAALKNINARYRDYCGFEAADKPSCSITPPLEATCIQNRCTLAQPYSFSTGEARGTVERPTVKTTQTQAPKQTASQPDRKMEAEKDGSFTAYDLPQDEVKRNIQAQYNRFSHIETAAGSE